MQPFDIMCQNDVIILRRNDQMNEEDFIMRHIKTIGKSLSGILGRKKSSLEIFLEEAVSDPTTQDDRFFIDCEAFCEIKKANNED